MNLRYAPIFMLVPTIYSTTVSPLSAQCSGSGASPNVEITCTGTASADVFTFAINLGNVEINGVDPTNGPYNAGDVSAIFVSGNDGDDQIDLSAVGPSDFVNLTLVQLDGGDGDDQIIGSDLDDVITGGPGCDVLIGRAGNDDISNEITDPCTYGCAIGGDDDDEFHLGTQVLPDHIQCGLPAPTLPPECVGFVTPAVCTGNSDGFTQFFEFFEVLDITTTPSTDFVDLFLPNIGAPAINASSPGGDDEGAVGVSPGSKVVLSQNASGYVRITSNPGTPGVHTVVFEDFSRVGVFGSDAMVSASKGMIDGNHFATTGFDGVEQVLYGGGGTDTLVVDTLGLGAQDLGGQITFATAGPINYNAFETVELIADLSLPVELTSFGAVADHDRIRLSWQTASEQNNAGFEIEQASNSGFETIGYVAGHGTTEEPKEYSFLIQDVPPGHHRFRLRQLDFDGTFSLSDVVEASIEVPGTHWVSAAFPNPFISGTGLRLSVPNTQSVSVILYDIVGRPVQTVFEGTVEAGGNLKLSIDGAGLTSGVYFARIRGESFSTTERVLRLQH